MNPDDFIELELSDGTVLEIPANSTPEQIRNYAQRGENTVLNAKRSPMEKNVRQYMSGVNESVYGTYGAPLEAVNWGLRKILPEGWAPEAGAATRGVQRVLEAPGNALGETGIIQGGSTVDPALEGYEGVRRAGNFTGGSLAVAPVAAVGAATAPAGSMTQRVLQSMTPTVAPTPGGAAKYLVGEGIAGATASQGGELAGKLAEEYLPPELKGTAEFAGMLAGGAAPYLAAPAARTVAGEVGNKARSMGWMTERPPQVPEGQMNAKPDARRIWDAAAEENVSRSGGLVGGKGSQVVENLGASVPFLGAPVANKQLRQNAEWGAGLQRLADSIRGTPGQGVRTQQEIGDSARSVAEDALKNVRQRVRSAEELLTQRIGPDTPVDLTGTKNRIQTMMQETTDPATRAQLEQVLVRINEQEARLQPPPIKAPLPNIPLSPKDKMAGLPEPPMYTEIPQPSPGAPYSKVSELRTTLGPKTGQPGLTGREYKRVYEGLSTEMKRTARQQGVSNFDDVKEATRRANAKRGSYQEGGDIPFLESVVNARDEKEVWNKLFGDPSKFERLRVLERNNPGATAKLRADYIERMGAPIPSQQGGTVEWSPESFLTTWNKLDPAARRFLVDQGDPAATERAMRHFDNLAALSTAVRSRNRETNQSNNVGMLLGAGALFDPVSATKAAAIPYVVSSEWFARQLAGANPPTSELLRRNAARAVGHGIVQYQGGQ